MLAPVSHDLGKVASAGSHFTEGDALGKGQEHLAQCRVRMSVEPNNAGSGATNRIEVALGMCAAPFPLVERFLGHDNQTIA